LRLKNTNICFATSKDYSDLTPSDRIAANVLESEGFRVISANWKDPLIHWSDFNAVIVRSTWDYHLSPQRFVEWLDMLERKHLPVWNPIHVLRWNMDKHYLLELYDKGVQIPRTVFVEDKKMFDLADIKKRLSLDEVVIKPTVSASAWNTWRCSLNNFSEKDRRQMEHVLGNSGVMIQEYMPEIAAEGEWSFIFFGSSFSHAVRKHPTSGDFRVQEEFFGKYRLEPHPPAQLIQQAGDVLNVVEEPLLYARIDGIVRKDQFILMELELLEPALFFDVDPTAAARFCDRVSKLLNIS
jgi:glutathione synthase/RimK-type ligase-like ATP-grasp enzyme